MHRESIYKNYNPAVVAPDSANLSQCYWFGFCVNQNKMLIKIDSNNFTVPLLENLRELNISPVRIQYLGTLNDIPCYSAEIYPEAPIPEGMQLVSLRSLYGALDQDVYLLAGKAYQIVSWDQTNQFCGRCGSETDYQPGERAKICPKCGLISYPRICPAVITAVLKEDKILLAHAKGFQGNMYSLIAGFLESGETLEECVQRELMEEVKIKVKNIKYFGSQPWPYPNSMMIGFIAEYDSGEITVDGEEIADAGWYDKDNLPELPSEMSIAREIIEWYRQK
jgi:NAD+ diphosphatase